jgi:hypothetical protein
MAEPSAQGLTFWGPITPDARVTPREAVVAVPPHDFALHSPSGLRGLSLHSINTVCSSTTAYYLAVDTWSQPTGTYPDGTSLTRPASVITGLLTVPGHHVQATRVILEVLRVPTTATGIAARTVSVLDEHNTAYACTLLGSLPPAGTMNATCSRSTTSSAATGVTRGVAVQIVGDAGADLMVQRAWVEVPRRRRERRPGKPWIRTTSRTP